MINFSDDSFNDSVDLIKLLKAIKGLTYHFEGQRYQAMTLHGALTRFYTLRQDRNTTNAQYLEKFQTNVAVVEQFGGNIGRNTGAVRAELESAGFTDQTTAGVDDKLAATQRAKYKYLAVAFLCSADKARYTMLLKDLDSAYLYGTNNYPVNVTLAYNLLVHFKNHMKPAARIFNDSEGVSFANVEKGPERRPKYVPDVTRVKCYACNKLGHYVNPYLSSSTFSRGKSRGGALRQ
jgi:hypothetical protein